MKFIKNSPTHNVLPRQASKSSRLSLVFIATLVLMLVLNGLFGMSVVNAQAAPMRDFSSCQAFTQVNNGAFDMGTGSDSSYSSEEGFEVLVYNNQLYLGMEGDNMYGARIWRTKPGIVIPTGQQDWEEVAADANGKPFGVTNVTQNDHIDSLMEFNGYLYASTANGGSNYLGTRIFRSPTANPGTWEDAITAYGAGFGDIYNTNFKDMQVFQGMLCGGTQNFLTGAQVWCTSNGTTWTQKNISGFGTTTYVNRNTEVWSGYVYNGALYYGVQNLGISRSSGTDDVGKLFRTGSLSGSPSWNEVYSGLAGSYRVDILGDLNGYLYIALRGTSGMVIMRSPSGDAGTWVQVNFPGMDNNSNNSGSVVDNAAIYDGGLYVGVSNSISGIELWRTSGTVVAGGLVDWEQIGPDGLGDVKNVHTQMVVFNDYLYAWTSNYITGQKVLRTSCDPDAPALPPTNTPTATNTPLPTATNTLQPTTTSTPLPTATNTLLPTNTLEPTPTDTPVPTSTSIPTENPIPPVTDTPEPTATNTPLPTNTPVPTATNTPLPTDTPEPTVTNTPVPTATSTLEPTATNTPEPTVTNTPLPTDTPEPTATNTPLPTDTPEPTVTNTPLPTDTPEPTTTNTPLPTDTPEPTATNTLLPTATDIPLPTETSQPTTTDIPLPTETPQPTATDIPLPTETPQPTATDIPLPTETPQPTSTPLPTLTDIPGGTPLPGITDTPFPTVTPLPSQTALPSDTPEPTATETQQPELSTPTPTSTELPEITPTTTPAYTPTPTSTAGSVCPQSDEGCLGEITTPNYSYTILMPLIVRAP